MKMLKGLLSFLPSLSFLCIANPGSASSLSFVAGSKRPLLGSSAPTSKLRRLSTSHSFTECKKKNNKIKKKEKENKNGWSLFFNIRNPAAAINYAEGKDLLKRDFAFIHHDNNDDDDDGDDENCEEEEKEDCNDRILEEMYTIMHDKVGISISAGELQAMISSIENSNNIAASSSSSSSPSSFSPSSNNFNQYELDSSREACRNLSTFGSDLRSDEKMSCNENSVDLLERVFAFIDEDGDGLLSLDEMCIFLQNKVSISISLEELQALLSNNSNNSTKNIGSSASSSTPVMDFQQFQSILAGEPSPSRVYLESKKDEEFALVKDGINNKYIESNNDDDDDDAMDCFCVFDTDGDGFISARELQSCLARMGLRTKEGLEYDLEACQGMIAKVDLDGDGLVDFFEFKEMVGPFSSTIIPTI